MDINTKKGAIYMKKLLKLTKGNRLLYFTAIISIAVATFIAMLEPMVIKITIDSVIGNKPMDVPAPIEKLVHATRWQQMYFREIYGYVL